MATTMQDSKIGDCIFLTPRVPQGLAAAVEGLTREVIRHRPENIYVFAAHHFEKLLRLREEYGNNNNNNTNENKKNIKLLREMNEAIKERHVLVESKETSNFIEQQSGWSLNETAKVLEKHRSIFGENGQKISTEEIRELAKNEVTSSSSSSRLLESSSARKKSCEKHNMESKYKTTTSSKRADSPRAQEQQQQVDYNNYGDSKGAPKIISQIPLTKDIKTELKKNRISSRERKKFEEKRVQVACCEYSRETTIEKTSRKSIEKTKRSSYESRSEHKKSTRTTEESSIRRKVDKAKDDFTMREKKSSRSDRTENVKDYVSHNFSGITNLDELQTPSYVAKVQEVIDETSTVIKEKVEALKAGVMKAQHLKKEQRVTSEEFIKSYSNRSSRRSQDESSQDSASSSRSSKSGHSAKGSAKSEIDHSKRQDDIEHLPDQAPESRHSDNLDGAESKISLPAVRPPSSKSTSRSQSARSDYDGLVLPPISPESTKSPKPKEELVLPVLSPPHSASPDVPIELTDDKVQRLEVNTEEVFVDSLNVTPEVPGAPQRPDSLETSEAANASDSSGHVSPAVETLKDKLLEIEEVQKRIENVLDDTVATKDDVKIDADEKKSEIQDKLREIQESEKRIEQILDSQTTVASDNQTEETSTMNSEIKSKLQELEEAERRITDILVGETTGEQHHHSDKTASQASTAEPIDSPPTDKSAEDTTKKEDSKDDKKTNDNLEVPKKDEEKENKMKIEPSEDDWVYSPHSYILTEGSPYDIPDTVTTVIIPDRTPSPDDTLQVELEDGNVYSTFIVTKEETTTTTSPVKTAETADDKSMAKKETEQKETDKEEEEKEKTSIHDAFGEAINVDNMVETSTVDTNYIRGIKASHDMMMSRKDLGLIKEEHDKEVEEATTEEVIDSEDEKVLKVVTSSLEEILEKDSVEYVSKEEVLPKVPGPGSSDVLSTSKTARAGDESTDETKETSITDGLVESTDNMVENSMDNEDITARSAESTNEIKETSIMTERSTSLSLDPGVPVVPELNLDSLTDLTISSFNLTDDEQQKDTSHKDSRKSSLRDTPVSSGSAKDAKSADEAEVNSEKSDHAQKDKPASGSLEIKKDEKQKSVEKGSTESLKEEPKPTEEPKKSSESEDSKSSNEKVPTPPVQIASSEVGVDKPKETEILGTNIDKSSVPGDDDINKSISDEPKKQQASSPTPQPELEENNLLAAQRKESLRSPVDDADAVGVKGQLSRVEPSQCTEPHDLSIKTNIEDAVAAAGNQSSAATVVKTIPSADDDDGEKGGGGGGGGEKSTDDDKSSAEDATTDSQKNQMEINRTSRVDELEKLKQQRTAEGKSTSTIDATSSSSSTFLSAVTVIQAGVRGFLLRRRLRSAQCRSSTLDSVPSIQESFVNESTVDPAASAKMSTTLEPIDETSTSPTFEDAKTRKKLCREDAVQKKTVSLENAFADNMLQHTGEFHDCIPLPVFDARALSLKRVGVREASDSSNQTIESLKTSSPGEPPLLGQILLTPGPFVDVVLIPGEPTDPMLQNKYLNFITSVEDVAGDYLRTDSPKGVIIEDITSLDNSGKTSAVSEAASEDDKVSTNEDRPSTDSRPSTAIDKTKGSANNKLTVGPAHVLGKEDSLSLASVTTASDEPVSMNIDEVLDLGEEDSEGSKKKLLGLDDKKKTFSQESQDDVARSPVTVMQQAGGSISVEGKSETDPEVSTEEDTATTAKEAGEKKT